MADESQDSSQKTEEPTQKRLDDAREKGQVASSKEINTWFMLGGMALVIGAFGPSMLSEFKRLLTPFLAKPHDMVVDRAAVMNLFEFELATIGLALLVPLSVLVVAAFASSFVQNGILFAPEKIKPTLDKISLLKGFKRMFSLQSLSEFLKGVFKIVIVAATATVLIMPELDGIDRIVSFDMPQLLDFLHTLLVKLMIGVVAVVTIMAGIDFLYQKFEHTKQLRMSRQEIKDELKNTEGDPLVKQRLRQIRQERARQRIAAAVPDSTVVITNPTHYAVALKYEGGADGAPVLTAKGVDNMAMQIRKIAEEHDVPIVENPPVARAIYAGVEIDQEIEPQHYQAVAEIIGYVMRLKGAL